MKEERHVDLILENLLRDVKSLKDFDEEKEPLAPPLSVDGSFRFYVTEDAMSLFVDLSPSAGDGRPLDLLDIKYDLARAGIRALLEEELARAIENCEAEKKPLRRILAAQGTPSVPPREGRTEILVPLRTALATDSDDEDAIDYREKGEIPSVSPGELLAVLHPPVPGEAGKDIYGREIAPAKPRSAALTAGSGVLSDDGIHFAAETWGQPHLEGTVLSVRPVLTIQGDVDYSTGNIRFDGSVTVTGNVREGFLVQAAFDISIGGYVESATLHAGRDVRIRGGLLGEKTRVDAGGSLRVRFVEGATLYVDGSILVESHILHGTVRSCDSVRVKGRKGILAGEVSALRRIDAQSAGSPMSSRTRLQVGENFRLRSQVDALDGEIRSLEKNLEKVTKTIHDISTKIFSKGGPLLPVAFTQKLRSILDQYALQKKRLNIMREKKASMESLLLQETRKGVIAIRHILRPGVIIEMQRTFIEITQEERFVSFSLNPDDLTISRSSYS